MEKNEIPIVIAFLAITLFCVATFGPDVINIIMLVGGLAWLSQAFFRRQSG